ncbi:MAG: hypothetical protein AB7U82_30015 [Blastocatellales bacterium]
MTDEMMRFQTYLQSKFESAVVNLTTFPSGKATIDVVVNNLLLTFEYAPKEGFAVSKIEKDEDAWDPQKCVTFGRDEFNKAKDCFLSLMEGGQLPT